MHTGIITRTRQSSVVLLTILALCASVVFASAPASAQATSGEEPQRIEPRIIGGAEVPNGDLPFVGYLISGGFYCGSTLIAPTWVMTAAHCVDGGVDADDVRVVLGRTTINNPDSGVIRDARQLIIHPEYSVANLRNDIALVRIDPVTSIEPVAVGTSAEAFRWPGGTIATVAGWGRTAPDGTGTRTLRQVAVPVFSDEACLATDLRFGLTPSVQICAGTPTEDACNGDSGGPLFVRRPNDQPVQFGIVSWGIECAGDTPGVYTETAAFEEWLAGIVFVGPAPELSVTSTCLSGNGLVAANVTNTDAETATITVSFGAITKSVSLAPGATTRVAVSGRPDGAVAVTADNAGGKTTRTVTVDCDPDIELVTSSRCLAGNGLITVVVTNVTASAQTYAVSVDGLAPRSSQLQPQQSATVRVSGRHDGFVPVDVQRGATALPTRLVAVDCDPDPTVEVLVSASCLASRGRIDVTVANINRPQDASYAVSIGNLAPRERLVSPDRSKTVSATGRPNGEIAIVVTRDGQEITSTTRTIDC